MRDRPRQPHHGVVEVGPGGRVVGLGDQHTAARRTVGLWLIARPGQQAHRSQRRLPQCHLGQLVLVAVGVGLPQRGCHRECRAVDGTHRPLGDELRQHGQGRRYVDAHQARLLRGFQQFVE